MSVNSQDDPFVVPIIFLRVTWMERYQGKPEVDKPVGGGRFVEENRYAHEMFNFDAVEGAVYGYV
jgi:hypothetical protein